MTPTLLVPMSVGVAVVAVLVLAGIAWAIVRTRGRRIGSVEDAAAAAEAALPGFATKGAVIGADGAAALAVDRTGRVAVMKRRGSRIATREVAWLAVRATAKGIVVETGDRRFGLVAITGVDALDVRRLAPADLRARLSRG